MTPSKDDTTHLANIEKEDTEKISMTTQNEHDTAYINLHDEISMTPATKDDTHDTSPLHFDIAQVESLTQPAEKDDTHFTETDSAFDADAEYEAAYAAIDSTLLFELAAGGSEGTRISDYITYEAGTPPRWRWLDARGEPLEDGTDSALTTLVAKLVFHPGSAAAFTGPLAAPNDPLFWPSHAVADRVWAYKRLSGLDETWDYATSEDASHAIPSGCWGYARDAKLPFWDLFGENTAKGATFESRLERLTDLVAGSAAGGYTNAELHARFNPANDHLPFVYEHFAWPHCGVGEVS